MEEPPRLDGIAPYIRLSGASDAYLRRSRRGAAPVAKYVQFPNNFAILGKGAREGAAALAGCQIFRGRNTGAQQHATGLRGSATDTERELEESLQVGGATTRRLSSAEQGRELARSGAQIASYVRPQKKFNLVAIRVCGAWGGRDNM